jgi:hypothetical protein
MKVQNMTSPRTGKPVANQFIIEGESGIEYFQSYDSIIVMRVPSNVIGNQWEVSISGIYLDRTFWDYSTTTGKYRNQFLGETKKETQAKIDSGEYVLTDLNG